MRKWYPYLLVAIAIVASVVAFTQMPERVPIHWNMRGDPDKFANRLLAVCVMPPVILLIALLLRVLPRLDPRRENYPKFQDSYDMVVNATLTLVLLVHFMMLGGSLGMPIFEGVRIIIAAAGVLLVIIGNVLPKTRPNWVFGLRTPWTVNNDRVWERSNRVGGYMLAAAGLLVIAGAFLPTPFNLIMLVVTAIIAALIALAYSYYVWKSEGHSPTAPPI